MNKNTNLVLFIVSFGALLLLLLTKLEFVLMYGKDYQVRDPKSSPYLPKYFSHAAEPEALIFGFLMIALAAGTVFFLYRLLKK